LGLVDHFFVFQEPKTMNDVFHKAICSDNGLFLPAEKRPSRDVHKGKFSETSLFLAGYEFARTGRLQDLTQKAGSITMDLYAHPAYRSGKVKYRRLFDIYSLF
jgi:hypothetical protein